MTPSAIRKAAILISTLESASADALLDQMEPEGAERVRNALMDLEGIAADEQEQIIAEFMSSAPAGAGRAGVEFDESLVRRLAEDPPAHASRGLAADEPPFEFLHNADPGMLAAYLEKEQPQTAAAVIAQLPPEQAAEVLERMPAATSTEALRRMAWLDQLAPEVLLDLARELRAALLPKLRSKETQLAGLASVQAVLSAIHGPRRSELLDRLAEQDQRLVRQLGYGPADHDPPSPAPRAEVTSFRYRLEPPYAAAQNRGRAALGDQKAYLEHEGATGLEFADLLSLDERSLRRVFAAADVSVLVLALTGAEEKFTRRILSGLPPREAEVLRQRLNHPGPLRLRDIEQAQQEIARLARNLANRGEIDLPSRHFAAAV